jgi:hypothetical protein
LLFLACSNPKNNVTVQSEEHPPVSKELYDTIARLDSLLFHAFNTRDYNSIKPFFSEDLEFYHDLGGVTRYEQNLESFKRTFESERRVRRELVPGTLEVYPIKDYGAVETGTHRFYATEIGQKEKLSSEAKFLQVWQKTGTGWKVTKVISYAHRENLSDLQSNGK